MTCPYCTTGVVDPSGICRTCGRDAPTKSWRDTCLAALRFGIEQTKNPQPLRPTVIIEDYPGQFEQYAEALAERLLNEEFA